LWLEGLGERISSPCNGSGGRSLAARGIWCILGVNLHPFDCILTNSFLCLLSIKRAFPFDIFVIHVPGQKIWSKLPQYWQRMAASPLPSIESLFSISRISENINRMPDIPCSLQWAGDVAVTTYSHLQCLTCLTCLCVFLLCVCVCMWT